MANYWKLYKKAKAFYFNIGKIKCPALDNAEIIFDWRGFRHFLHKGRHKRSMPDQIRRFGLLFIIKKVIESAEVTNRREEGGTIFHELVSRNDAKSVRFVVLEHKSSKKYFISIMNQK
jgi:hypothetical protein